MTGKPWNDLVSRVHPIRCASWPVNASGKVGTIPSDGTGGIAHNCPPEFQELTSLQLNQLNPGLLTA